MIHWIDKRFTEWGAWLQSNRGLGSKGLSASWDTVGGGGAASPFVPVQSIECSRTHDWVLSLSPEHQCIMLELYCTPHTAVQNARVLKMSLRTMYARLHSLQLAYAQRPKPSVQIEF